VDSMESKRRVVILVLSQERDSMRQSKYCPSTAELGCQCAFEIALWHNAIFLFLFTTAFAP
jgi:hypothetical protein